VGLAKTLVNQFIGIPENFLRLHKGEEDLRTKAEQLVFANPRLALHLHVTESAMELADMHRQMGSDDEDQKVIRLLGMRCFNAFAASIKLSLSGYWQVSAMVLRDVLETVFLLDLFQSDPKLIAEWRKSDDQKKFKPYNVRNALDIRDSNSGQKRAKLYKLFCELAAHPTMKSDLMMRPKSDGDAFIGPFITETALEAVVSEMGKLAVQVGELLLPYLAKDDPNTMLSRNHFASTKSAWMQEFWD
jgi:hypothetical protein